jgi:hypothetical protein
MENPSINEYSFIVKKIEQHAETKIAMSVGASGSARQKSVRKVKELVWLVQVMKKQDVCAQEQNDLVMANTD